MLGLVFFLVKIEWSWYENFTSTFEKFQFLSPLVLAPTKVFIQLICTSKQQTVRSSSHANAPLHHSNQCSSNLAYGNIQWKAQQE